MNAHIGHLNNNILSGYSYNEMEHLGTECQKTWRDFNGWLENNAYRAFFLGFSESKKKEEKMR